MAETSSSTYYSFPDILSDSSESILQTQQPSYRIENKIWGAVLEFFGAALKLEQTNGKIDYVRISEFKEKLVLGNIANLTKEARKKISNDAIINDLFLSTINPFKKTTVTVETLNKFNALAKERLHYPADPAELYGSLREICAAIHTQKGMTHQFNEFIDDVQVGDIIFHRTEDAIHSDIVQFQRIANTLGFGPRHRDAIHHNHVYMCAKIDELGKRWFAEAAWPSGKLDEIRLISEEDARCFMKQNHGAISERFRCRDSRLAERAAEEALRVTTALEPRKQGSEEQDPTALRYSIKDGARALFSSNRFGHFAKMRLIQQVRSTNQEGSQPIEFVQHKAFFCSSLVGYSYQVGEARPMVTEMLGENSEGSPLMNRIHSNILAIRHREQLDRELNFKIDPKRSSPGDLYTYLCENKALFASIQSYQQPSETASDNVLRASSVA